MTAAEYQDEGYAFLATPNIKYNEIDFDNVNYVSNRRYEESPELKLKVGDVLLAKDGKTLGITNIVHYLPRPATVNGSIAVIRPFDADSSFVRYVLASDSIQGRINALKDGMDVPHLFQWDIRRLPIPLPHPEEQQRIARFLNWETARIDELITARQKQLRILEERWRVVARDIVSGSNGHDPVHTIHPDLAWLGPMNPDWPHASLKRTTRTYMGTTFPHNYQGQTNGDFPFIKVADFNKAGPDAAITDAQNWVTKDVASYLGARIVPKNSVLYARTGAAMLLNQRRVAACDCIIDDNVRGLMFTTGNVRYWLHLLTFLDLGRLANPGPVPSVSDEQVSAVHVPLPPPEEQDRIASILDGEHIVIDRFKNLVLHQLQTLAERRQALITAVVTGQVDVTTASGTDL